MLLRNPTSARAFYILCVLLFIAFAYQRFDDPLAFACMASGIVITTYFIYRGIQQLVGN